MNVKILFFSCLTLLLNVPAGAQNLMRKEIQYLSGTDVKHSKKWDFYCTGGRKSGQWTQIAVPGHWEQQGFGNYNYGRDNVTFGKNFRFHDEKGIYKHEFSLPPKWEKQDIYIVFEGVMTDAEVSINGQSAGPVHRGAFYRFKYKINDKIHFSKPNQLEVRVSKMSAEQTVNNAERLADYWIFGGIFRPVYLEAVPKENIDWTSIDAKADGRFHTNVHLNNAVAGRTISAEIFNEQGKLLDAFSDKVKAGDSTVSIRGLVDSPLGWTAETPHLYTVKFHIKDGSRNIYSASDKFGFRTIEVRKQDGIYVNGSKIKIKGINRHVFWPEYGRATYPEADLIDVKLIKEMNMNAVRCSHYPPDQNFLRVCDSLGLYVVDELAGWQKAYSTEAGRPLLKEMVIRDTNHPAILLWSNGNEGGHNKALVDDFAKYDLSRRVVIHAHHKPGNAINGIDCNHYEDYYSTAKLLADTNLYMPTEFLHAMNDGGGAAGLADMWELHYNSKNGLGGFIWNLADEGIMRSDLNGMLDVNGINAADGVVGPHREKEGSVQAIREIYSPVHMLTKTISRHFNGAIELENRYHFSNLSQCTFKWELINFNDRIMERSGHSVAARGDAPAPDIAPGKRGILKLSLAANWQDQDALALTAYDPHHQEIYRWVWNLKTNTQLLGPMLSMKANKSGVKITEKDSLITMEANGIGISLNRRTGLLEKLTNTKSASISFGKGPVLVSGSSRLVDCKILSEGDSAIVEMRYSGNLQYVRWKMQPTGWLEMNYQYTLNGSYPFTGISFSYPEGLVLGAKWLGKGPSRVWKNRLQGVSTDVYQSRNNNTQTGSFPWSYPEFKGYFSDIVWMELSTMQGKFTIASPDSALFVRLFDFYSIKAEKNHPALPVGDISFLDGIPATGSKMGLNPANVRGLGPASELNKLEGPIKRSLYFYFGSAQID